MPRKCLTVRRPRSGGFTLVELLVVIAVIAILASIIFAVGGTVQDRMQTDRARGELQSIAVGLEQFKARYSDFPWLGNDTAGGELEPGGNSVQLYQALMGQLGMTRNSSGQVVMVSADTRPFVDAGALNVAGDGDDQFFVDPWGRPYYYFYITPGPPSNRETFVRDGFILVSSGPDGQIDIEAHIDGDLPSGYFDGNPASSPNADNLVFNFQR
ncbi:MAG: prepilin-type N-terminal cleavage/methylation domain-containing protein [Opitutales bacterium]